MKNLRNTNFKHLIFIKIIFKKMKNKNFAAQASDFILVNKNKIKKFTRVIQTYLLEKGIERADWSAALIAIRVDTAKKIAKVRFIENLVLQ